jgi:hypothetical protein
MAMIGGKPTAKCLDNRAIISAIFHSFKSRVPYILSLAFCLNQESVILAEPCWLHENPASRFHLTTHLLHNVEFIYPDCVSVGQGKVLTLLKSPAATVPG